MRISNRNIPIYFTSQFLYALVFTIPIWIVYYQGRISVSQISLLIALQFAVQLIFELPTGALADLVGRKVAIAIGYLLWSISYVMVFTTEGFYPLIAAALTGGLGESFISGSLEALVFDTLKQDKREGEFAKISAKNGVFFQFGLAAATMLGGFMYGLHWSLPYAACALSNAIAFVLALFFIEPTIDSEKFSLNKYFRQIKDGSRHAFASTTVAMMSIFYVAVSAITWTNNLYFFDYMLVELGFPDTHRGMIGAMIRIFNVAIIGALLRNDNMFTRRRSIYFFPIVMSLCFLPGVFFQGVWALPFVAGAVMAGTARWIILTKYTNEMFESRYRATSISVLSMLIGVLFIGITFISGPIIEHLGGVRMMYTLLGLMTLVTVVPLSLSVVKTYK